MSRHAWFIKLGLDTSPVYATKLIADYVSYGIPNSISIAHQVFDQVPHKDTPLWTSIISAYARSNQSHKALHLFSCMLHQSRSNPDARPNHFVFTAVARAITSAPQYLSLGKTMHAHVVKSGYVPGNIIVETAFLDLYMKCGVAECARKLFDEMSNRNLVTWNAMISGYIQNGQECQGLELFYRMKCRELYVPDEYSVATVLSGCAYVQDPLLGVQVHGYAFVSGFELSCRNSLANMYFYCGRVASAEKVFVGSERNLVSKLVTARGYVFNHMYADVVKHILLMENAVEIFVADQTIFVPLLTTCAKMHLLNVGKQIHGLFIILVDSYSTADSLKESRVIISSALMDMYSKCSDIRKARKVFESWLPEQHVPLWNSLLSGYIHNELIEDAKALFENMPEKTIVSWTSMMTGYVQKDLPQEGLNLLAKMYSGKEGSMLEGNCLTFVVALEACARLTDLNKGKQIHAKIIRALPDAYDNVAVGTALVDMYSKSGNLCYTLRLFDAMEEKNVVSWTSAIMGFAIHGFASQALELFQRMVNMGIMPNEVTFIAVLTACSHCGLVDEGMQYFTQMRKRYGLMPEEEHYTCLIDLLGRNGRLEEAWHLVEGMEENYLSDGRSTGAIWAALLGACQLHGNFEIGKKVAGKMMEREKQISTASVALSNVYAAAGMWNEVYGVRESWRKEGHANGEPGLSRICAQP
ncbi:PREDICTED: pentatricopeptide repeat-containing protein At2g13600-like [Nicotiana attenuata]|uniref:Pentatricopeptide repeat-containing protein n=1 Tax=Nicotiana attenuata TaxID=49451 RepID=A0A314L7K4_NICAT|nr:PREDICTED: pentatricopeptide repeat-containing protein At2g13600-like [Nicotiana attenuata]OIT37548.1 pentatricopeptide repeat-containing protein [Nicotiana attenuata]